MGDAIPPWTAPGRSSPRCATCDSPQPGVWLQIGIETSGRLIGDIAVRVDGDQARQATVGFTLAADAQGDGYATEALRTVISLLFTEHDVHRICADCDTRNDRSVSLLERRHAPRGSPPQVSLVEGEWTDEDVYAILAEEWPDKSHGTDPQPPAEAGGRDR